MLKSHKKVFTGRSHKLNREFYRVRQVRLKHVYGNPLLISASRSISTCAMRFFNLTRRPKEGFPFSLKLLDLIPYDTEAQFEC